MAPPPKASNKANHKGKRRHFSTPEEIQQQLSNIKIKDEENDEIEEESSEESNSESDEDIKVSKPKGVSNLIEIENPNRTPRLNNDDEVRLSRRQREEVEKAKAKERYFKLAAQAKTEQSKADLARLEVIRKQREEANRKRETEKQSKEAKGKVFKN